jgi:hypothetical protein
MRGKKFASAKIDASFQLDALPSTDGGQYESESSNRRRPSNEPLVGISPFLAFGGVVSCFCIGLWGWNNFYKGRRLFGTALIGGSWLLGALGLLDW